MQPLRHLVWILPENSAPADFQVVLTEKFDLKSKPVKKFSRSWYDTFDWRLFRKNLILVRQGSRWILGDFQGNQLYVLASRRKTPGFWWQFPESPLRDALQGPLDVRSLMGLGIEDVETKELHLLNRDKKIVALLQLEESTSRRSGQRLFTVILQEIRGYAKWFHQVAQYLDGIGVQTQTVRTESLQLILQGTGRTPLDYSSGYDVPLDPQMESIEAVGKIYRALLASIRWNEQGVIDDIDSEFLHDLRVAVRRTRSALALMKGVLAPEVSGHFKKVFRYIGQITGPVRDLDVYLLQESDYKQRLPDRLQEGLGYFFDELAARRKQEQQKLVQAMASPQYKEILTDWQQTLDPAARLPAGKNGEIAIGTLAGKIIHKRFLRVLKDGQRIGRDTPDSELHQLRIECKKLRYSLEFFSSLYDQDQIKKLVGQLKKLQNNLGDFNDLSVQQEMLADYLTQVRPGSKRSRELAASLGGLMTGLSQQHREVRTHFEETFALFASGSNLDLFHGLFGD